MDICIPLIDKDIQINIFLARGSSWYGDVV